MKPDLLARPPVAVRPLEWEEDWSWGDPEGPASPGEGVPRLAYKVCGWRARDCFGAHYEISIEDDGFLVSHKALINDHLAATEAEAKHLAQDDYASRIHSALIDGVPDIVAAARIRDLEAALREAEEAIRGLADGVHAGFKGSPSKWPEHLAALWAGTIRARTVSERLRTLIGDAPK